MKTLNEIQADLFTAWDTTCAEVSQGTRNIFSARIIAWGNEYTEYTGGSSSLIPQFYLYSAKIKQLDKYITELNSHLATKTTETTYTDGGHVITYGGVDKTTFAEGAKNSKGYIYPEGYDGETDTRYLSTEGVDTSENDTTDVNYGKTETYAKSANDHTMILETDNAAQNEEIVKTNAELVAVIDRLILSFTIYAMGCF